MACSKTATAVASGPAGGERVLGRTTGSEAIAEDTRFAGWPSRRRALRSTGRALGRVRFTIRIDPFSACRLGGGGNITKHLHRGQASDPIDRLTNILPFLTAFAAHRV